MTLGPDARIGIVGAGAAGLSAAHFLARSGRRNVTLLEAGDRVGGKCHTIVHEGRSYELGAGAVTSAYDEVRALMREHGVRASAGLGGAFVDVERNRTSFIPPPLLRNAPWRIALEAPRLAARMLVERRLLRPGFDGISDDVELPFATWARKNGVERIAALIEPWFTGFGYGYFDEIPAAYVLKYLALFRFPVLEILEGGYQGLWERVAAKHDVRLGAAVQRVTRGSEITVETTAGAHTFDALILACPVDAALGFMDASPEERDLWSRVRFVDYHVVGARLENGPRARYGFFPAHFTRQHAGEVVFFYRRWLDRDLVLYYTLPGEDGTLAGSVAAVRATVERLGGRILDVPIQKAWRYFPHVRTDDLRGGYYEKLESMQGTRNTWLAGELCAFTAVEPVVAYSRALVERMIRAAAPSAP
jgi:hypothetical protein